MIEWIAGKLFLLKMYLTKPHTLQVRYIQNGVKHLVLIERRPFSMGIAGRYTVDKTFRLEPERSEEEIDFPGQVLDV